MHFLISVIDTSTGSATPEEIEAIDSFNAALRLEGQLVFAGGLAAPDEARVIDGREGETVVVDGPLHDAKEHVSGFWLLDVPDPEIAPQIAAEASRACQRRVELRPLL